MLGQGTFAQIMEYCDCYITPRHFHSRNGDAKGLLARAREVLSLCSFDIVLYVKSRGERRENSYEFEGRVVQYCFIFID